MIQAGLPSGLPSSMQKLHHRPSMVNIMNEQYVDIICLQETWLSKQDLNCLNTLHTDCHRSGVATVDYITEMGCVEGMKQVFFARC